MFKVNPVDDVLIADDVAYVLTQKEIDLLVMHFMTVGYVHRESEEEQKLHVLIDEIISSKSLGTKG